MFTAVFVIGVQLPNFIQQYSQRLAGHLAEAQDQLSQYQVIANLHFDGSLKKLVARYQANPDPAINEIAVIVDTLQNRVSVLELQYQKISQTDYLEQLIALAQHLNREIAGATIDTFAPALPLTIEAFVTGAILALCFSALFSGCGYSINQLFNKRLTGKSSPMT